MRVALIGNTAWNSSILARGLRRLGVEADSFDRGGGYFGELPQWERGLFGLDADGLTVRDQFWGWDRITNLDGSPIPREPWEKIIGTDLWGKDERLCKPWYDTQEAFQKDASILQLGWRVGQGHISKASNYAALRTALEQSRTPKRFWPLMERAGAHNACWRSVNRLVGEGHYDLVVLFGEFVNLGPLLPRDVPYVTFEHGTMRYVSSFVEDKYRAPALGYQLADHNVITNADVISDAGNLGIRHKSSFIPHPFDESRFTPGESPADRDLLRKHLDCELLFLAPARHSRSETAGSKRNDRIIHAFKRYVSEAEPAGAPKAGLVLLEWGDPEDTKASDNLIISLGLKARIAWHECAPRPKLASLYRAADVVLDQFSDTVGSFGTTTVEAMSSGKPVISYYNPDVHTWCLDVLGEHPPILTARTVDEIYERLVWQAKHERYRQDIGKRGREWVEQHHSLERVSKAHKALYERVVARKKFPGVVDWNAPTPNSNSIDSFNEIEIKAGATA